MFQYSDIIWLLLYLQLTAIRQAEEIKLFSTELFSAKYCSSEKLGFIYVVHSKRVVLMNSASYLHKLDLHLSDIIIKISRLNEFTQTCL